ncbi:MAG: phosphotransferase family protein [Saprospiraceae bacterium]|nr:phosphotransferase family protein [Saprospiraceae bacterium]
MSYKLIDQAVEQRKGEELDTQVLLQYLNQQLGKSETSLAIYQFPGGFSNLTYLLKWGGKEMVLRRPPFGAKIKSAHDMGREYKVLSLLLPHYAKIPAPLIYCQDESVLGAPFYVMDRVSGMILRNRKPKDLALSPELMQGISKATIDNLVHLHQIDLHDSGLIDLGKPEGYTKRQVEGWIKRYRNAQTDDIANMDALEPWLRAHMPSESPTSFIHNDYKYDNLVLNPNNPKEILAVLDWEMSTVGNPFMDLGTTLAYWGESKDTEYMRYFSLTWLKGNFNRQEVVDYYQEKMQKEIKDIVFYYVFGQYKLAVIAQQIYARYKKGLTKDPRFALLLYGVQSCAEAGAKAIELDRISQLH